jgi:membrane associated rhomboid family serine protease
VERIASEPDGALQLARMAEVDRLWREPAPVRVTWVLAAACVGVYALEAALGPTVTLAGSFSRTLFEAGELWRILTANLLHASLPHLVLNVLAIVGLGSLVERPLGAARTAFVIGLSAFGAMGAAVAANYEQALGASGIACGLAGAFLWLELRCADRLPAPWRVPRRLLLAAIATEAAISFSVPNIAAAAHAGGFVAGLAACAAVARPGLRREPSRPWLTATNAVLGLAAVLALVAAGRELAGDGDMLARSGARLLRLHEVSPQVLNNTAWMIATSPHPTPEQLSVALRLAERAVDDTNREDPNVLDTLAESQFASGKVDEAVETIDEAIALAPDEPYFVEQRRRFVGDRDAGDRPEPPPDELPVPNGPDGPSDEEEPPGVSV